MIRLLRRVRGRHCSTLVCALMALASVCAVAEARTKTDVLMMDNGDRITCEIRELQRGIVEINTEYTRTIQVEWIHVDQVTSNQLFVVEVEDGRRFVGALGRVEGADREMTVIGPLNVVSVAHDEVVRINAINESMWDQFKGSVDLGFTAKKANSAVQYSLGVTVNRRTRKRSQSFVVNSIFDHRDDATDTVRNDISLDYRWNLKGKRFIAGYATLEQNEELGLDLRALIGGGYGYYLMQSNTTLASIAGGLASNREDYTDNPDTQYNVEASLSASWEYFLFGRRETDISTTLVVLPSVTSWGRVRSNLNARLRHELFKDFTISLSLLANYDSEPPTEAQLYDWSLVTSVGYSF